MLKNYIEISLGISAAVVLLLIAAPLLRRRYSAAMRRYVWIFLAALLLVPVRLPAVHTIYVPQSITARVLSGQTADEAMQAETDAVQNSTAKQDAAAQSNTAKRNTSDTQKHAVTPLTALTAIWLSGAGIFLLYHLAAYALFRHKILPWRKPLLPYEKPRVYICPILKSPVLTGFLRPEILLPRADYSESELKMILNHERAHYKRGDLYVKLLLVLANAVHWFNPFIYVMRRTANRDIEYACDERVVKNMDIHMRQSYSMTILHCAAGGIHTALSTYFKEDKKKLKQRFKNILSTEKRRGIAVGCIICVLLAAAAGIFGLSASRQTSTASPTDAKANYLLLGTDEDGRADAIMLVSSYGNAGVTVTSVPRDTVLIKEMRSKPLDNEVIQNLTQTVSVLTDCPVKAYTTIDISSAEKMLERVSGVEFEIPDLYGDGTGMVYDDPYKPLHINLAAGAHTLSAEEMIQVMRYRKGNVKENDAYMTYENGDVDRIEMTHSLLREIFAQKKTALSEPDIPDTAYELIKNLNSNIALSDIKELCSDALKGGVTFSTLDGEYASDVNLQDVYVPDNYDRLLNTMNSPVSSSDSEQLSVRVTSLKINGAERISEAQGDFGIWLNSRLGAMHLCLVPALSDGTYAAIQPYNTITYDSGASTAHGDFVIKTMTKSEGGESLSKEIFSGSLTGLSSDAPLLLSDDGKYEIQLDCSDK